MPCGCWDLNLQKHYAFLTPEPFLQPASIFIILKHYLCACLPFTPRLKQERELMLTQLSEGLAAELTELTVTECVWETCSQELK